MSLQSRSLREEMFFFPGTQNRSLLGLLHCPDAASGSTGLVYCHPFAEEKNMSHAVVARASRLFAAAGFPVMRFDFSGCGDSEGDLQCTVVEEWLNDLDAAVEAFRKETGVSRILFWGLRMGAGVALLHTGTDRSDADGFVLWQPVLDFSLHIRQFLRRIITSEISRGSQAGTAPAPEQALLREGLLHVMGYPVSAELYASFMSTGSQPANIAPSAPVLVLSVSSMEQPAFTIKQYANNLKDKGTPVTMHHVTAEPFWDRYWQWECRKAADVTLQWLRNFV